jgi:hypothetical protein
MRLESLEIDLVLNLDCRGHVRTCIGWSCGEHALSSRCP